MSASGQFGQTEGREGRSEESRDNFLQVAGQLSHMGQSSFVDIS